MARSVDLYISEIAPTGQQVQVDQYEVELTFKWVDNAGQSHERTETVTFPNVLSLMTPQWLKENLSNLLIGAARTWFGIDEEE